MRIGTRYSLLGTTCSGADTRTHTCTRIYCTQSLTGRLLSPSPGCRNWLSLFTNVAPSDSHISSRLINRVGVTMSALCVCVWWWCVCLYMCMYICRGHWCAHPSHVSISHAHMSMLNEPTDAKCVSGWLLFSTAGVFSH